MPILSCNCLNIKISHKGGQVPQYRDSLPDCPEHEFFANGVYVLRLEIVGVHSEIGELLSSTRIGNNWDLYTCLNCNLTTHSVHVPSYTHAANLQLNDREGIVRLMSDPNYSPTFCMVLPASVDGPPIEYFSSVPHPQSVQKLFSKYIAKRESESAARIRQYEAEEQAKVNAFIEKASEDRGLVMKLLHSFNRLDLHKEDEQEDVPQLDDEEDRESNNSFTEQQLYDDGDNNDVYSPSQQHFDEERESDDDYLFDEDDDGGDVCPVNPGTEDSGCAIPTRVTADPTNSDEEELDIPIAQSMPINIPMMPGQRRKPRRTRDIPASSVAHRPGRSAVEYAASMLAISRSLHQNPLGPRPKKQSVPDTTYHLY